MTRILLRSWQLSQNRLWYFNTELYDIILNIPVYAHLGLKEQFLFPWLVLNLLVSVLDILISYSLTLYNRIYCFQATCHWPFLFLASPSVRVCKLCQRRTIVECKHMADSILTCFSILYYKNFQTFSGWKNFAVNSDIPTISIIYILLYLLYHLFMCLFLYPSVYLFDAFQNYYNCIHQYSVP